MRMLQEIVTKALLKSR